MILNGVSLVSAGFYCQFSGLSNVTWFFCCVFLYFFIDLDDFCVFVKVYSEFVELSWVC